MVCLIEVVVLLFFCVGLLFCLVCEFYIGVFSSFCLLRYLLCFLLCGFMCVLFLFMCCVGCVVCVGLFVAFCCRVLCLIDFVV